MKLITKTLPERSRREQINDKKIRGDAGMNQTFVQLGSIAEFINGAAFKPEDWGESGLRIIRIQNLTDSTKQFNRTERIVSDRFRVQHGDLLVSWSATLGVFEWHDLDEALLNQHIFRVLPNEEKVNKRYLRHGLEGAILDMQKHLHGATMQHVNRREFLSTKLYLPPLEEQKRIAEILDRAEELRAKRREAIGQLDTLTQAIFIEMFGNPVRNPKLHPVVRLGSLTKISSGSTPSRKQPENFDGNIPWVKTTEVNGYLITDTEEKITQSALQNSSCHVYPVGSILIALYGQGKTRGQCAVLGIEAATNQACGVLLPNPSYITNFLFAQLSMSYSRLRAMARGGNQENLNLGLIADFTVLLPCLPLQQEFAHRVEAVEKLKTAHRASLSELNALFASLQNRAFKGEL